MAPIHQIRTSRRVLGWMHHQIVVPLKDPLIQRRVLMPTYLRYARFLGIIPCVELFLPPNLFPHAFLVVDSPSPSSFPLLRLLLLPMTRV